ncbi:putative transposase [Paenibacillus eucommiae]|uniref:Transposase n=1 Tax=Paenibacillus eucommiae TaxID=1355755 RepID=A0ABS4JAZ3_9BACL|nr:putative transposase [Paenibacillus eucommiae]
MKAYRINGLKGLELGESPGRPSFLTEEQEDQVRKLLVDRRPSDVGFPSEMNRTAPLLQDWIQREFNVTYSERGTRKLLRLLGFSFTKPTYTLALADSEKQEQFKQAFETVKKIDSARN